MKRERTERLISCRKLIRWSLRNSGRVVSVMSTWRWSDDWLGEFIDATYDLEIYKASMFFFQFLDKLWCSLDFVSVVPLLRTPKILRFWTDGVNFVPSDNQGPDSINIVFCTGRLWTAAWEAIMDRTREVSSTSTHSTIVTYKRVFVFRIWDFSS